MQTSGCITHESILLYVERGLSPEAESAVDAHVATCSDCRRTLNQEKEFTLKMDGLFADAELEVPDSFAKVVRIAAESEVEGLRDGGARKAFAIVMAVLGSTALLAVYLGYSLGVEGFSKAVTLVVRMISFASHSAYGFVAGVTGVVKSVCSQYLFGSLGSVLLLSVLFLVSLTVFSRLISRQDRV